jgi:hypothetical protein
MSMPSWATNTLTVARLPLAASVVAFVVEAMAAAAAEARAEEAVDEAVEALEEIEVELREIDVLEGASLVDVKEAAEEGALDDNWAPQVSA